MRDCSFYPRDNCLIASSVIAYVCAIAKYTPNVSLRLLTLLISAVDRTAEPRPSPVGTQKKLPPVRLALDLKRSVTSFLHIRKDITKAY